MAYGYLFPHSKSLKLLTLKHVLQNICFRKYTKKLQLSVPGNNNNNKKNPIKMSTGYKSLQIYEKRLDFGNMFIYLFVHLGTFKIGFSEASWICQ